MPKLKDAGKKVIEVSKNVIETVSESKAEIRKICEDYGFDGMKLDVVSISSSRPDVFLADLGPVNGLQYFTKERIIKEVLVDPVDNDPYIESHPLVLAISESGQGKAIDSDNLILKSLFKYENHATEFLRRVCKLHDNLGKVYPEFFPKKYATLTHLSPITKQEEIEYGNNHMLVGEIWKDGFGSNFMSFVFMDNIHICALDGKTKPAGTDEGRLFYSPMVDIAKRMFPNTPLFDNKKMSNGMVFPNKSKYQIYAAAYQGVLRNDLGVLGVNCSLIGESSAGKTTILQHLQRKKTKVNTTVYADFHIGSEKYSKDDPYFSGEEKYTITYTVLDVGGQSKYWDKHLMEYFEDFSQAHPHVLILTCASANEADKKKGIRSYAKKSFKILERQKRIFDAYLGDRKDEVYKLFFVTKKDLKQLDNDTIEKMARKIGADDYAHVDARFYLPDGSVNPDHYTIVEKLREAFYMQVDRNYEELLQKAGIDGNQGIIT